MCTPLQGGGSGHWIGRPVQVPDQLARSRYIAGGEYTIADIATVPWLCSWFDEIAARPALVRGVEVLADRRRPLMDDKARSVLFGAEQYQRH